MKKIIIAMMVTMMMCACTHQEETTVDVGNTSSLIKMHIQAEVEDDMYSRRMGTSLARVPTDGMSITLKEIRGDTKLLVYVDGAHKHTVSWLVPIILNDIDEYEVRQLSTAIDDYRRQYGIKKGDVKIVPGTSASGMRMLLKALNE